MGKINWYLGFEVMQNREFGLTMAKLVTTPMDPGAILTKDQIPSATSQTDKM